MRCNMQWHSLYIQLFCFNTIPSPDDDRWDPWWSTQIVFCFFFFTNGRNNNKKSPRHLQFFQLFIFTAVKGQCSLLKRQQETLSSFCFAVVGLRFDIGLVYNNSTLGRRLEALAVDNGWTGLVVLLLGDPHLLEGGEGG